MEQRHDTVLANPVLQMLWNQNVTACSYADLTSLYLKIIFITGQARMRMWAWHSEIQRAVLFKFYFSEKTRVLTWNTG